MELEIKFANKSQKEFYYSTARNQCFSGGFNNGKTYSGCLKALTLLSTFPNYRMAIARETFANLKKTTMQTFFKLCPKEILLRHNEQDGLTEFYNKSVIHWLHLDKVDESTLRGLEINSALVDQAEETEEKVYDILDGRIGRWDLAQIPSYLLDKNPNWPKSPKTGKFIAPSYNMLLCNPDTQFHYIYRKFHPESIERDPDYFYVEGEWDAELGSSETFKKALQHDEEWVNRFVRGQWGVSSAQIHYLPKECILEYDADFFDELIKKGNLFRIVDHGDSSPTCCLWLSVYKGNYYFYREYYTPDRTISFHRRAIADLSGTEKYSLDYADPQIFKKTSQKDGGFWSVADEYMDPSLDGPPFHFQPADNNEFATRNRINELLRSSPSKIYFIKKSGGYEFGCQHAITELQSQRRKSLGYINGKQIFCDEREESVADHAYDCVRYAIAMHSLGRSAPNKNSPRFSFKWYQMMAKRQKSLVSASTDNGE